MLPIHVCYKFFGKCRQTHTQKAYHHPMMTTINISGFSLSVGLPASLTVSQSLAVSPYLFLCLAKLGS